MKLLINELQIYNATVNVIFRPIKLVVAKCWDPNPKGYFTIPRTEPVRPIDPGAWVAHTAAIRGEGFPPRPPSATTLTSTSSSLASTLPDTEREFKKRVK